MNAAELVRILEVLKWVENQSFFANPPDPKIAGQMKAKAMIGAIEIETALKYLEVEIER